MSNDSAAKRLDALLTFCESAVTEGGDEADFAVGTSAALEIDSTRSFIMGRVARHKVESSSNKMRDAPSGGVARRRILPRDAAGRRRLLGRLIATRPDLPRRISVAFESREPEDSEVAEMLRELLRDDGKGSES